MKRKTKVDEKHDRIQRRRIRKTAKAIGRYLRNPEGLARLRAISDEEWDKAAEGGA